MGTKKKLTLSEIIIAKNQELEARNQELKELKESAENEIRESVMKELTGLDEPISSVATVLGEALKMDLDLDLETIFEPFSEIGLVVSQKVEKRQYNKSSGDVIKCDLTHDELIAEILLGEGVMTIPQLRDAIKNRDDVEVLKTDKDVDKVVRQVGDRGALRLKNDIRRPVGWKKGDGTYIHRDDLVTIVQNEEVPATS